MKQGKAWHRGTNYISLRLFKGFLYQVAQSTASFAMLSHISLVKFCKNNKNATPYHQNNTYRKEQEEKNRFLHQKQGSCWLSKESFTKSGKDHCLYKTSDQALYAWSIKINK